MYLSDLLKIVTTTESKLKNYRQRVQLPFSEQDFIGAHGDGRVLKKRVNFSLNDALRLQIMSDLSEYKSVDASGGDYERYAGLPPVSSSNIAQNGIMMMIATVGDLDFLYRTSPDIWLLHSVRYEAHEGRVFHLPEQLVGSLLQCAGKLESQKDTQARAILVNISQSLRGIVTRGKAANVAEVIEFLEGLPNE